VGNIKQNTDDWNPYFIKYSKGEEIIVFYEKSWFCNDLKIIHKSKKQYTDCPYCNTKEDRDKYLKDSLKES